MIFMIFCAGISVYVCIHESEKNYFDCITFLIFKSYPTTPFSVILRVQLSV